MPWGVIPLRRTRDHYAAYNAKRACSRRFVDISFALPLTGSDLLTTAPREGCLLAVIQRGKKDTSLLLHSSERIELCQNSPRRRTNYSEVLSSFILHIYYSRRRRISQEENCDEGFFSSMAGRVRFELTLSCSQSTRVNQATLPPKVGAGNNISRPSLQ